MKITKNEKGFLLIDSLVGIMILTIALLAIAGTIMSGTKLANVNSEQTKAYKLAQESMEKMKQIPPSIWLTLVPQNTVDYKSIGPTITIDPNTNPVTTIILPSTSGIFTCTNYVKMSTSPVKETTGEHMVQVKAEVRWTSKTQTGKNQDNVIDLIGYCERQEQP